jgi:hypothetical protein
MDGPYKLNVKQRKRISQRREKGESDAVQTVFGQLIAT